MAKSTPLSPLEETMVNNYVRLIQRGKKEIKDVPNNLKTGVEQKLGEVD